MWWLVIKRLERRLARAEQLADNWEDAARDALAQGRCRDAHVLLSAATGVRLAIEDR